MFKSIYGSAAQKTKQLFLDVKAAHGTKNGSAKKNLKNKKSTEIVLSDTCTGTSTKQI
jgi:hypothetical protein